MGKIYNKFMEVLGKIVLITILTASLICITYGLGGVLVLLFSE